MSPFSDYSTFRYSAGQEPQERRNSCRDVGALAWTEDSSLSERAEMEESHRAGELVPKQLREAAVA